MVVSIDGLPPEHDARRTPATYHRFLTNIAGHQVTVHCTVTRQQVRRDGYLEEFSALLAGQREYTPDLGQPVHPPAGELSDDVSPPTIATGHRRIAAGSPAGAEAGRCSRAQLEAYATPPGVSRRMHLRADDRVRVGGSRDDASRRASSAAIRTAPVVAASRRPAWRRFLATACRAGCRCANTSTGRRWPGVWWRECGGPVGQRSALS